MESAADRTKIVPYVVPSTYPLYGDGWSRPLGHDLHVVLAEDCGQLITPLRPDSLLRFGVESVDECWKTALENIDAIFKERVKANRFPAVSPERLDLILCGASWLAASCILMTRLRAWATKNLVAAANQPAPLELLVSIPNPEALLIFPKGTFAQRQVMRQTIREAEAAHRKPLTWEFFELSPQGLRPFVEPRRGQGSS